jgi:hypothetical protein
MMLQATKVDPPRHVNFDEPRKQMLNDLQDRITALQGTGYAVVLLMDCNEDIRSQTIKDCLTASHLREATLASHGSRNAPATHIHGSKPIDGIFISHTIQVTAAGYTAFDD